MSAPVSRVQVLAQRFAALVIGIVTLMLATAATLWIFSVITGRHGPGGDEGPCPGGAEPG